MNGRFNMSFQKINKEDTTTQQGRECILVYGFGAKDYSKLKNYCMMMGIRDLIQVDKDMLNEKVQNILEDEIKKSECNEAPGDKAIIINAFSGQKLHTFLGNFKRTGLRRPLIATVTPTSLNWTVLELVSELQKEREAIAKSNQALHEKNEEEVNN